MNNSRYCMCKWSLWGYSINIFGEQWWFLIYNSIYQCTEISEKLWVGKYSRNIVWDLLDVISHSEYMESWLEYPTWYTYQQHQHFSWYGNVFNKMILYYWNYRETFSNYLMRSKTLYNNRVHYRRIIICFVPTTR